MRFVFLVPVILFANSALAAAEIPVRGRVVDEKGAPLASATIELWAAASSYEHGVRIYRDDPPEPRAVTYSDDKGFFALKVPEGGRFRVVCSALDRLPAGIGFGPLFEPFELRATKLPRAVDLRVRVNALGKALAGVRVNASALRHPGSRPEDRSGLTEEDGVVVLPRGESEVVELTAFAPGFVETVVENVRSADVTLTLEAGVERTVEVRGPDRKPFAGALVRVGKNKSPAGLTGEDGRLAVLTPRQGRLPVTVETAGWLYGSGEVAAPEDGETDPVVLVLREPETVSGRVTDASTGRPLAGAWVWLGGHVTQSAGDGSYSLPIPIDAGHAKMSAMAPGYLGRSVTVVARSRVVIRRHELALQPAPTKGFGRVSDLDDQPVAGARVRLWRESAEPVESEKSPDYEAMTDDEGRFEVRDLGPGRLVLVATAPGFAVAVVPGLVVGEAEDHGAGEDFDFGTVRLEDGLRLRGRVVDREGQPIGGVRVRSHSESVSDDLWRQATTAEAMSDEAGRFVIADRTPGERLMLTARRSGYVPKTVRGIEAPSPEGVTLVLERSVTVRGQVVDRQGSPVPGAKIRFWYEVGGSYSRGTETDVEGRFEHEAKPGKVHLSARSGKLGTAELWLLIEPDESVEDVRLVLEPSAVVAGRVLGPDDQPVAGARIRADQIRPGPGFESPITDGEGRFRITGLETGPLVLRVIPDGLPQVQRQLDVKPGMNTLAIRLASGYEVHGHVLGEEWQGLGGARVSLLGHEISVDAASGPDGDFVLKNVPDGTYQLRVSKEGFHAPEQDVTVDGAAVFGLQVRLAKNGAIVGSVLGLDEPVQARVRASRAEDGNRARGSVGPRGGYRIESLPPGDWTVDVLHPASGRKARGLVTLEPGVAQVELDLELASGYTLSGLVLIDGEPASAYVRAQGVDVESEGGARASHRGVFRIGGLAPGRYRVEVGKLLHSREIELRGDDEVRLELTTGGLEGRVLDAVDGAPLSDVTVKLASRERRQRRTTTDQRGVFRFEQLVAGSYRLRARRQGYELREERIEVEAGVRRSDVELALERSEKLVLDVALAAGGRPRRVKVAVFNAAGRVVDYDGHTVTDGGTVRLGQLRAGSWSLLVWAHGSGTARLDVSVPGSGNPVPVVLPPEGRLRVVVPALAEDDELAILRITDADGRPFVSLERSPHENRQWRLLDGRALVRGLSPGMWNVRVTTASRRSWGGSAAIPAAGGTVKVVLE